MELYTEKGESAAVVCVQATENGRIPREQLGKRMVGRHHKPVQAGAFRPAQVQGDSHRGI